MPDSILKKEDKLAVLIDADNTSATIIESLMMEIAKYGNASIKRIYGDWTMCNMNSWKNIVNVYAIVPMQQFSNTSGKNSTDTALIIDAMDLLYSNKFDGFCIVSSDSDFTRLAIRIRQNGCVVYGFGRHQTPAAFRAACDEFIYTENITNEAETEKNKLYLLIKNFYERVAEKNGYAHIPAILSLLRKTDPSFDYRTYGYKKAGDFFKSTGLFEVDCSMVKLKN
jgi:hypothetical protein